MILAGCKFYGEGYGKEGCSRQIRGLNRPCRLWRPQNKDRGGPLGISSNVTVCV